ncbi:MAG: family 16 glycosylhydrolase [Parvularculaceae bacterium]
MQTFHPITRMPKLGYVFFLGACMLNACAQLDKQFEKFANAAQTKQASVVAINLGGADFTATDGTIFLAGAPFADGGEFGCTDKVLGTPDALLYKSFRAGAFEVAIPMVNGLYDVTIYYTEPLKKEDDEAPGAIIEVALEGNVVLSSFHVPTHKINKAGARTFARVKVADGSLEMGFSPRRGTAKINAVLIRPHVKADLSVYQLLWADEFDTDGAPDPEQWNTLLWDARKVNDEDQTYTDFPRNVRVENGRLIIEAHHEKYNNAEYTSARLTSEGHDDLLYGRIEVRAKLPIGQGTWPAIWLYPTDDRRYADENCTLNPWEDICPGWPNSGEIDIMEHVGHDPGVVHSTIHTKAYYWINGLQRNGTVQLDDPGQDFHTYAINWHPDRLNVFFDDSLYFTYLKEPDADWQTWPFDHPYHVILNLAIGGWWGRGDVGIDDAVLPQRLEIDYVRVYQRREDAQ